MITLDIEKDLYILEDLQGMTFGGGIIFEGIDEVADQFIEWAYMDDMELPEKLKMPDNIGNCLSLWLMNLYKYNGTKFRLLDYEWDKKDLDYLK